MFKKIIFVVLFLNLLFLNIPLAYGQGILPAATGTTTPSCKGGDTTYCGDYGVNDFVQLAVNISQWILGIVGSLALVMFIYGGLMFLISAGSSDKIAEARKIIVAAAIGLIIVFASYLIIKFVLLSLGLNWRGSIEAPSAATSTSLIINRS